METSIVCLGCGCPLENDPGRFGPTCACPPPLAPPSSRGKNPYRDMPDEIPCPRCRAALVTRELADVVGLECVGCLGLFLDVDTVRRITSEEGHETRVAFPRRHRAYEPAVQYIPCISCQKQMNRTVFAKISGVIVDVCKDHGVWFDAGEINSIIQFVEEGGMERASQRLAKDKAVESKRLADERKDLYKNEQVSRFQFGAPRPTLNRELRALFDLW